MTVKEEQQIKEAIEKTLKGRLMSLRSEMVKLFLSIRAMWTRR